MRRKTAKYLQRAEKLHKKYLEGQGNQNLADRWDVSYVEVHIHMYHDNVHVPLYRSDVT